MENNQIASDRSQLQQLEPWEFQYYTINFGCSEEALKKALNRVGSCPDTLRHELGNNNA